MPNNSTVPKIHTACQIGQMFIVICNVDFEALCKVAIFTSGGLCSSVGILTNNILY